MGAPEIQTMVSDSKFGFGRSQHFLDDPFVFWTCVAAIVMDWQFISFCFNMLPIITLDGADFWGSWVRLCSTPIISAIFIIITSVVILAWMAWTQLISPGYAIIRTWDEIQTQPKFADPKVYQFLLVGFLILQKLWGLIKPTVQLISRAMNDKLHKYHFTQDNDGKLRAARREAGLPARKQRAVPRRHPRQQSGHHGHNRYYQEREYNQQYQGRQDAGYYQV